METAASMHLRAHVSQWPPPVVIGGTGGSGTRIVAQLLRSLGVALGDNVNQADDAIDFVSIYDKYVNAYLENGCVEQSQFAADVSAAIFSHRRSMASTTPWGWKNPRSIYLLPLFDNLISGMTFVHVIRHGIDMALSKNQIQLAKHGRAALGASCDTLSEPLRSALLWQHVNEATAAYGQKMPGRYFRVRYEDACAAPRESMAPIACALGLDPAATDSLVATRAVAPRWPSLEATRLAEFRAAIGTSLERFGYRC